MCEVTQTHKFKTMSQTTETTGTATLSKVETNKLELAKVKSAIEALTAANVPIPASLSETYDKLKKAMEGNASQQTADLFNKTFGSKINDPKNAELQAAILKLAGESGVRMKIVSKSDALLNTDGTPALDAEGKPTFGPAYVFFDVAGATGGAAKTGNVGVTRSSSQSDTHAYQVLVDGLDITGSPFESASKALDAIVNGGKNPMNLPAGYGKGNSAVRVLESLKKNPIFAAHYVVNLVEKTKEEAPVTAATAEKTTA